MTDDGGERLGELQGQLREIERERAELAERLRALDGREQALREQIEELEHRDRAYVIFVDDVEYSTTERTMTGAAIKALAGKDSTYQLFEEHEGGDDTPIADAQSVHIRDGLRFYTVPPATFGNQ